MVRLVSPIRMGEVAVAAVGVALVFAASGPLWAGKAKFNRVLEIGSPAPEWRDLPGTDGTMHSLSDFHEAQVLVVVFTCNHCPVAKIYEMRLLALAKEHADDGVKFVAINVNRNHADSLEKMKARASEKDYPFAYLYDHSQKSARDYGATVTPHYFVLDAERRIAYMGAFDDHFEADKVQKRYVADAVDALLAGKTPPVRESLQRGCGIEFE